MQTIPSFVRLVAVLLLSVLATQPALAGPKNATVLLIRHAEKSLDSDSLTPAGEARAKAYIAYFQNYKLDGAPLKLATIYATADSKKSHRPRATVEPLAQALGLTINSTYANKDFAGLVADIDAHASGQSVLVCWHHGSMPELLTALGANPATLLPQGQWPNDQYGWLLELRYDAEGKLVSSRRVVEGI